MRLSGTIVSMAAGTCRDLRLPSRREAACHHPAVAVSLISDFEQAEAIVGTGDADLIALALTILYDPRWPWHAAAHLGAGEGAQPVSAPQPRQ